MQVELKPQGPPLEPKINQVIYDGKIIVGETFLVREQNGNQEYVLIREPNTRPYTKVSLFKRNFCIISDQYTDLNPYVRKWFR